MKRAVRWLCCVVAVAALWPSFAQGQTASDAARPNVLFIVCDDLTAHVSTAGYEPIFTPAMDRLAAEGTIFRRAYCQYPVCGPSRASFLSGLYPESTGVLDNTADIRETRPEVISLPELFKRAGYWTGGVGKVFHGRMDHGNTAWHEYLKFENEWNPVVKPIQAAWEAEHGSIDKPSNQKAWRAKLKEIRTLAGGQTPPGYGPTDMTDAQHKDGKNVRQISQWLDTGSAGDKPFFMVCGIQKPHVPFWAPQKYFDMYPKDELVFSLSPTNDWDDIPGLAVNKRYEAFGFNASEENDSLRRDYTQAYHACISFIDAQFQMLFDSLDRNGLWDNTVIVLTSDHGYHLGEHFMWGKVTLFEECARVPMIVRVPGRTTPGTISHGLVQLVDVYPTLAELCNVPVPEMVQGQSFTSLLDTPEGPGRKVVYTVVSRGPQLGRAIRTARWRYAEWGSPEACELYDLDGDPKEYTNLAANPEYAQRLSEMRVLMESARESASR